MATLHVICGKAGAGKTTLARSLGHRLPALVFCEDEWIATLGFEIRTLADFTAAATKCRALIAPLACRALSLGLSVVFDFAGNTVKGRAWAGGIAEQAGADRLLHYLEATDAECLAAIRRRNAEKPAGVYYGAVSDETFHAVTAFFVPPGPEEGWRIRRHARARAGQAAPGAVSAAADPEDAR